MTIKEDRVKLKGLSAGLLLGYLISATLVCEAHQHMNASEAANRVNTKLTLLELKTESQLNLFSNLFEPVSPYFQVTTKGGHLPIDKQTALSTGRYRQKLREFFTVHFNDSVQIGIDQFKVAPIGTQKSEIVQVGSYLQTQGSGVKTARGYGLELKVTLD